jgi:Flp pilus assembly pilin Flp
MKTKTFKLDQSGQGLTEYIALLLLIAVVSFGVTKTLGSRVKSKIKEAADHINSDISLQNGAGGGSSSSDSQ